MFRIAPVMLATLLFIAPETSGAATPVAATQPIRSATKARDIGGFTLGMHIRDAAKLAPVEGIGNGQYQTTKDGIKYDFGVTSRGHIYRIDSEQTVGRFTIDDAFLQAFASKLTSKYGPPNSATPETFHWSLIEPVKRTGGETLPFETNWASAYVENEPDGVTIHVKLIDFRVMWTDDAQINREPRSKAVGEIAL